MTKFDGSNIEATDFHDNRLTAYYFDSYSSYEIDGTFSGYDQQGHEWRGSDWAHQREEGKIIKEFFDKTIFLRSSHSLLGYIRGCLDGTWLAHSCYYEACMDGMEVYGFKDEFYAIRYLHEILVRTFPNQVFDSVPTISNLQLNLLKNTIEIHVCFKKLDSLLGYIKSLRNEIWVSNSFCQNDTMNGINVLGFENKFYATRYLYQVANARFPEIVDGVPSIGKISECIE